jgi:RsiW-degrading membrane proteinase PrsW (M82 family)
VPYVHCPCGLSYDSVVSPAGCPKCGKSPAGPAPVEDKIRFACSCGARLASTAKFAGRTIDCPSCGQAVPVPAASTAAETARAAPTARRAAATAVRRPPATPDGWRSTARWSMLLALVPLAIYTFTPDDAHERTERYLKEHPEVATKLKGQRLTLDTLTEAIPSHRIEGAALSRKTWAHWIVALLAALIFWEFILIVQPMGNSTSRQLWAVGAFTGTVGILMLLIVQFAAIISAAFSVIGGCALFFFLILRFIGYSYGAAMDPNTGFVASLVGFTLGVGLCEELCKALPLFWHFRKTATLDVRGSVVWGLATGIGFGVSEGISYSHNFYNGMYGGGIYVVRFISCVALHAVWSATAAILIWKRQDSLQGLQRWYQWFSPVFKTLGISMLLHGFYDTVLKKQYGVAALAIAIFSFALFFWLYDRACHEERNPRPSSAFA